MGWLELRGIGHRYGDTTVLDEVSLEVDEGELLVLVGPSGCGKSTLLRIVAGLVEPTAGEVAIAGRTVNGLEPRERDVAMVFQSYALYPHMTVQANLAFPLKIARLARRVITERVARAAATLGLEDLLDRKPGTLSGGQMQRVALGRALVRDPRVFLFDEPLSNLDAKLRTEMRAELARLHRELGITTLYVTHDQAEAMTLGARVCVLDAGRVQQVGTPLEVFARPATAFVAAFLGNPPMNLLRGSVAAGRFHCGPLDVPFPSSGPSRGFEGEALLGIRPHDVAPGDDLALEVVHVEALGAQTHLHLALGDQHLIVTREGHADVATGERIGVAVPPAALHAFDAATGRRCE